MSLISAGSISLDSTFNMPFCIQYSVYLWQQEIEPQRDAPPPFFFKYVTQYGRTTLKKNLTMSGGVFDK